MSENKSLLANATKKASIKNAREMIIFSYPKVGKTEALTKLPGDYLILDFDIIDADSGGTDFYDSNSIVIDSLGKFDQLAAEFTETQPKYDFIVIDTITSLYNNLINQIAVRNYNREENKKKPLDWDITRLTYGVGYAYKRDAMQKVIDFFKKYCKCLILTGHVADKAMTGADGSTLQVKDLDIEGKLKNILALKTDALALLKRTSPTENTLSFTTSSGLIGGTRVPHLSGKDIVLSRKLEDGTLETYWEQIFIN